ncbi:Conserved_hypothetical protein [Hexamita inflata]|uniref:HTH myb-type domain-containing protein n=1 Tax=Hexamita inflata TaxID=28002 RepID=A0AA86VEQ8_9EUKA|nr:Conserved hypothetical protein [Hexamita inflata]
MQSQILNIVNASAVVADRYRRKWTLAEQRLFQNLYRQYRKDFKLYVPHFHGRTEGQIRSFYQNVVRNNKLMQNSKKELQYVDNTLARSLQIHKRKWTTEEQMKFTRLYKQYQKDFKKYVPYFDGRTEGQIKSFYQNVVHNNKVKRNSNVQCVNEQRDHSQLDVDLPLIVFDAIDFQLM